MNQSLEQGLRAKRDEIAYQWYQSIMTLGSMIYFRQEALEKFGELTDSTINYLTGEHDNSQEAFNIGVNLAKLHIINPRVIEITGNLWSGIVEQLEGSNAFECAQLRLMKFYQVFAGYFEQSRRVILSEQE